MRNQLIDPVEVDKGYGQLANAIVLQAVADYRRLLRGKLIADNKTGKISIKECEDFFLIRLVLYTHKCRRTDNYKSFKERISK